MTDPRTCLARTRSLVAAMVLTLACSAAAAQSPPRTAAHAPAQPTASIDSATVRAIDAASELVIGYLDVAPFSSPGQNGTAVGYSIDLCEAVVEQMRKELHRPFWKTRHVLLKPEQRIPAVQSGRVHMECSASTNTVARQDQVAFSYSFYLSGIRALVRGSTKQESATQMFGARVSVTASSTAQALIEQLNARSSLGFKVLVSPEIQMGFDQVAKGETDAFFSDDSILNTLLQRAPDRTQFRILEPYLSIEPYALMLPRNDPEFVRLVNRAMRQVLAGGGAERAYAKWFVGPDGRVLPMSRLMKEILRQPSTQPAWP